MKTADIEQDYAGQSYKIGFAPGSREPYFATFAEDGAVSSCRRATTTELMLYEIREMLRDMVRSGGV